ncbi:MAG: efflux RND transporter periplasmic adaptor subunit [Treponema sp.]|nr:efflux RND transporter periplasmic adaptor subunit [Treponema sp.]
MGFTFKDKISPVKLGIFAALTLLAVVILISIIKKDSSAVNEFYAPVITVKPIYGNLEKTLKITSQVETNRLITVVPRVSGTLISLGAKAGDFVKEDQILAQVDSAPYELTYLQAQSSFQTARTTFERIRQVYQTQGGVSRQNYDEARMTFEVARAQYELAQLNLDYTKIRSPMDAAVLMRHGTEGSLVAAGTPLVTLGDLDNLMIKAAIPEIHYRFFSDNWQTMPVRLLAPALGEESFDLKPLSLAPYVSPENRSFLVEYEIPKAAEKGLRPGMFVNVIFILEKKENVYYLPFKVFASGNRLWYAAEDKKAQYIEITADFFNNDYFQIPSELCDIEFILEGQHFITPGQNLNILGTQK